MGIVDISAGCFDASRCRKSDERLSVDEESCDSLDLSNQSSPITDVGDLLDDVTHRRSANVIQFYKCIERLLTTCFLELSSAAEIF